MVEKPTEGKCSECGSEDLIFHDDGSGRCPDCGRVFRWVPEQEINEVEPAQEEVPDRPETTHEDPYVEETGLMDEETARPGSRITSEKTSAAASGSSVSRISRSKRNGFHPTNKPKSVDKKEVKKGFLWIAAVGFILLMVGYGMFYSMSAVSELGEEPIEDLLAFKYIAIMLNYVGVILVGLGLVYGAATADHLDDKVRSWMLAAMAILLGLFLGLGWLTMNMF